MIRQALMLATLALPLAAARSDPLAGFTPGPEQSCIDVQRVQGPEIVDEHTVLYRQTGGRIWKTGSVGRCPSLQPLSTLVVEIYGGQLCRNDRFRVLTPGTLIPSGYCRFKPFVPYTKVPAR